MTAEGYVACPRCGSLYVTRPSYTWWGGILGPMIICHVRCNQCAHTYNGKTGQSNTGKIVAYYVVLFVVLGGVGIAASL